MSFSITIDAGETATRTFSFTEGGAAKDLTGLRVTLSIASKASDAPLKRYTSDTGEGIVKDDLAGTAEVTFDAGDTGSGNALPAANYHAALWLDDGAGGSPVCVETGRVHVNQVVRRTP